MKKTLYILTCVNCCDSEVVSVDAYPTKEEAQAAMKEDYEVEFNDMVNSGWDEEDIANCSDCFDMHATLGWGLTEEPYKWDISAVTVEL